MTEQERERKEAAHFALVDVMRKIKAINGPWRQMQDALDAAQEAYGAIIEDEVYAVCECCDTLVWMDDPHATDERGDCVICQACADREIAEQQAG